MFYHKWIPRMIMKTRVFPWLSQIKAYANIFAVPRLEQYNFFFLKPSEENSTWFRNQKSFNTLQWSLAAFKQTWGADQYWQIPPCQAPTSQRDRHFLYAPCSHWALWASCRPWCSPRTQSQPAAISLAASGGCFIVTSISTLFWNHQKLNLISFELAWKMQLFFKSLIGFWQSLPQALFFMASLLLALFSSGWSDRQAGKWHKCMKLSGSRQILNETEIISFV